MESINPQDQSINYAPSGITLKQFHESEAFVRGIMGPIGSGKSTACVLEILRRAALQEPWHGVRYTRWAIIRNTYPELKTTTLKTWGEWAPQSYGRMTHDSPLKHHIKTDDLDIEVLFLALDNEEDQKKLLSLELTGAWINEAREVPKAIFDTLTGRVGRYPSKAKGGATWSGVLLDTNPPDDQSWWFGLAEDGSPEGYDFFRQPAGDGAHAENLENLPKGYYERIRAGKDDDWIKVYIKGEYGFVIEGKPVFPMFRDSTHTAGEVLKPAYKLPFIIGCDFGLTPAAIIGQKLPNGRWLIIDEYIAVDVGVIRFAELFAAYMATTYPNHPISAGFGDPAGAVRGHDEQTPLQIMNLHSGYRWHPAPTNDVIMRVEVVVGTLNRMIDGIPGFLLSPKCRILRKALSSGYHYKSIKTSNGTQFHDKPNKNQYSHPADALQYLLLGGGEHHVVMGRNNRDRKRRPSVALGSGESVFN